MKALLCLRVAVPAVICASKANTSTGFGLLSRYRSLSFPRSTGPFIRAALLCSCSVKPPNQPSEDSNGVQDGQERDVDITPVNNWWMRPWEVLLDHIFGPPNNLMIQMLDPVYEVLQDLKIREDLQIGNKEYDALLALVQVYFNLKDYEKAKVIQGWIQNCKVVSQRDSRPHLLKAILNLTLAVEKLRKGKITATDAEELEILIKSAEESWEDYKNLREDDLGLKEPEVEENRT